MGSRSVPFRLSADKRGCATSLFPFPRPFVPLPDTGSPHTPREGGLSVISQPGPPGFRHGQERSPSRLRPRPGGTGRARLRPAVAHTPDPGLGAGSCVAPGASGSAAVPCPARPGPRSRAAGGDGRALRGGRAGAAGLRAGRGALRPPLGLGGAWAGPRRAGGAGGLAWPCLALRGPALPCPLPCRPPAPGRLLRRDHPRPSGDRGPAGQPSSSPARRALVQACRL